MDLLSPKLPIDSRPELLPCSILFDGQTKKTSRLSIQFSFLTFPTGKYFLSSFLESWMEVYSKSILHPSSSIWTIDLVVLASNTQHSKHSTRDWSGRKLISPFLFDSTEKFEFISRNTFAFSSFGCILFWKRELPKSASFVSFQLTLVGHQIWSSFQYDQGITIFQIFVENDLKNLWTETPVQIFLRLQLNFNLQIWCWTWVKALAI